VKVLFAPVDPADVATKADFEFVSDIKGGSVPKEYIPGVQKGIESVLANGVLAGFPVLGLKVSIYCLFTVYVNFCMHCRPNAHSNNILQYCAHSNNIL
jgi:translation elongation factor EF-G